MTTLLAAQSGDWTGALVIFGLLAAILVCGYGEDLAHHMRTRRALAYDRYVEEVVNTAHLAGVIDLDHAPCEGRDCDNILCCCEDGSCPGGFVEQGCVHHNLLCDDCRSVCDDCRLDARDDAGVQ